MPQCAVVTAPATKHTLPVVFRLNAVTIRWPVLFVNVTRFACVERELIRTRISASRVVNGVTRVFETYAGVRAGATWRPNLPTRAAAVVTATGPPRARPGREVRRLERIEECERVGITVMRSAEGVPMCPAPSRARTAYV